MCSGSESIELKDPNKTEVKDSTNPQGSQPTRTPIAKDQFPEYIPYAGDHAVIDPQLSMVACQIVGFGKNNLRPDIKMDNKQQDAYSVVRYKSNLFPENYRLARACIFRVWQLVAAKYSSPDYTNVGGATTVMALSHKNKLYVSQCG